MIAILNPMSSPGRSGATPTTAEPFDRFYMREFRPMVALAYSISGSGAAAEDIAQEAMTRAFRSWSKLAAYDNPGTWLRRVTINLSISNRRRTISEAKALLRIGGDSSTASRELSEQAPIHDDVWDAIRRLPTKQRAAVALHYLEDRSVADVADILECSEATARVHLHRGRNALHAMLDGGEA